MCFQYQTGGESFQSDVFIHVDTKMVGHAMRLASVAFLDGKLIFLSHVTESEPINSIFRSYNVCDSLLHGSTWVPVIKDWHPVDGFTIRRVQHANHDKDGS